MKLNGAPAPNWTRPPESQHKLGSETGTIITQDHFDSKMPLFGVICSDLENVRFCRGHVGRLGRYPTPRSLRRRKLRVIGGISLSNQLAV